MKHTAKEWFAATRYWSFPVSSMPVVVTCAYLFWKGAPFNVLNAILAVVGIVVLHAAGNVLSDYFDYKSGVDNAEAYAVPNLVEHFFEPKEYLIFSLILFAVGCAIGLTLVLLSGPELLIIGGIGVLLTLLYSWLKYHALGDLDIFFNFSILPLLGTSFVVTGSVMWEVLVLALPIGLITVSVLHINNTTDIATDGAAGIKSFAMLLGEKPSVKLYIVYQMLPFVLVLLAACLGLLPWFSLLCFVAFRVAWTNICKARGYFTVGREAILGLDQMTAKMQLAFSLTLSLGLLLAALL